jgi:hypothetical protein
MFACQLVETMSSVLIELRFGILEDSRGRVEEQSRRQSVSCTLLVWDSRMGDSTEEKLDGTLGFDSHRLDCG